MRMAVHLSEPINPGGALFLPVADLPEFFKIAVRDLQKADADFKR